MEEKGKKELKKNKIDKEFEETHYIPEELEEQQPRELLYVIHGGQPLAAHDVTGVVDGVAELVSVHGKTLIPIVQ